MTLADTLIRTRPILRRRERVRFRRDFAWPFFWSLAACAGPAILWLWSIPG